MRVCERGHGLGVGTAKECRGPRSPTLDPRSPTRDRARIRETTGFRERDETNDQTPCATTRALWSFLPIRSLPFSVKVTRCGTQTSCLPAATSAEQKKALSRPRTVRSWLCRARIAGAGGDIEGVHEAWSRIARLEGSVELSYGDWFFLPDEVHESPAFWRVLYGLGPRLLPCVFPYPDEAWTRPRPLTASGLEHVMAQYHLARTRRDARALAALARRYPTWRAPAESLALLQRAT